MKEEPVLGNEVVNERLTAALDTCFSGRTLVALGFPVSSQQKRETPLMHPRFAKTRRDKQCPARTASHDQ